MIKNVYVTLSVQNSRQVKTERWLEPFPADNKVNDVRWTTWSISYKYCFIFVIQIIITLLCKLFASLHVIFWMNAFSQNNEES